MNSISDFIAFLVCHPQPELVVTPDHESTQSESLEFADIDGLQKHVLPLTGTDELAFWTSDPANLNELKSLLAT